MKMFSVLILAMLALATMPKLVSAQVRYQIFGGGGMLQPVSGEPSGILSAGAGVIVPVRGKVFVRAVTGGGIVYNHVRSKSVLVAVLAGYRLTNRVSLLVGGAETFVLSPKRRRGSSVALGAGVNIGSGWLLITPIMFNKTTMVGQFQLAHTW